MNKRGLIYYSVLFVMNLIMISFMHMHIFNINSSALYSYIFGGNIDIIIYNLCTALTLVSMAFLLKLFPKIFSHKEIYQATQIITLFIVLLSLPNFRNINWLIFVIFCFLSSISIFYEIMYLCMNYQGNNRALIISICFALANVAVMESNQLTDDQLGLMSLIIVTIKLFMSIKTENLDGYQEVARFSSNHKGYSKNTVMMIVIWTLITIDITIGKHIDYQIFTLDHVSSFTVMLAYCFGCIIFGFIADKNYQLTLTGLLIMLIFPILASTMELNKGTAEIMIFIICAYYGMYIMCRNIIFTYLIENHLRLLPFTCLGFAITSFFNGISMSVSSVLYKYDDFVVFLKMLILLITAIMLYYWFRSIEKSRVSNDPKRDIDTFLAKYDLTGREAEITRGILNNKTNKEIANQLYVEESTVRYHTANVVKKLCVRNKKDIIRVFNEQKTDF